MITKEFTKQRRDGVKEEDSHQKKTHSKWEGKRGLCLSSVCLGKRGGVREWRETSPGGIYESQERI